MTKWIEDPTLEAPDGHKWMKPAPDDCPDCPCHTLRVCERKLWMHAKQPMNPDGSIFRAPCPCEAAHERSR